MKRIIQWVFGNENASDGLWWLVYCLMAFGVLLVVCGVWGFLFWNLDVWWLYAMWVVLGAVSALAGLYMFENCQVSIPGVNPKSVGVLCIWDELQPVVARGRVMSADFFPFYIKYSIRSVEPDVGKFKFEFSKMLCAATPGSVSDAAGTPARSGGTVKIVVEGALTPDVDDIIRLLTYYGYGSMEDVLIQLRGQLEQTVRHTARKFDWELLTSLKEQLTVMLLVKVAKVDFRKLDTGPDGLVLPELLNISYEEYIKRDQIIDPLTYLFPDASGSTASETETKRREQEMRVFLRVTQVPNIPDDLNLGSRFVRLNVPDIEPEDGLAESNQEASKESKQREKETMEVNTNNSLAERIVEASGNTISFDQAYRYVMTTKGLVTNEIKTLDIPPHIVSAITAALEKMRPAA